MATPRLPLHVIGIPAVLIIAATSLFAQPSSPPHCTLPEYSQFDFWIGDWDVFELGSTISNAHVRVDRILDGCALREHYEDNSGTVGESFTTYDRGRKLWHQTWVTNRGRLLTIEGGRQNGTLSLSGAYYRDDGGEVRVRGTWAAMGSTVRESAVTSSDAGKTWNPWFDLSFRPRRLADNPAESDYTTSLARIDEQFQAAVKANDAETMDKILADDFILVTGTGKVFNKRQSLDEARSHIASYEHQEDTERMVRVWGNTGVVTAKLWIKGTREGKPIDYVLWFSDTYLRTRTGWRCIFGQASLPFSKLP